MSTPSQQVLDRDAISQGPQSRELRWTCRDAVREARLLLKCMHLFLKTELPCAVLCQSEQRICQIPICVNVGPALGSRPCRVRRVFTFLMAILLAWCTAV